MSVNGSAIVALIYCLILICLAYMDCCRLKKSYTLPFNRGQLFWFIFPIFVVLLSVLTLLNIELYFTNGLLEVVFNKGIILFFLFDIYYTLLQLNMLRAKPLSEQFRPSTTLFLLIAEYIDLVLLNVALYFYVINEDYNNLDLLLKLIIVTHGCINFIYYFYEIFFQLLCNYNLPDEMFAKYNEELASGSSSIFSLGNTIIQCTLLIFLVLISKSDLLELSSNVLFKYSNYFFFTIPIIIVLKFGILHSHSYRYYMNCTEYMTKRNE